MPYRIGSYVLVQESYETVLLNVLRLSLVTYIILSVRPALVSPVVIVTSISVIGDHVLRLRDRLYVMLLTFRRRNYFFKILAHSVYKM